MRGRSDVLRVLGLVCLSMAVALCAIVFIVKVARVEEVDPQMINLGVHTPAFRVLTAEEYYAGKAEVVRAEALAAPVLAAAKAVKRPPWLAVAGLVIAGYAVGRLQEVRRWMR